MLEKSIIFDYFLMKHIIIKRKDLFGTFLCKKGIIVLAYGHDA